MPRRLLAGAICVALAVVLCTGIVVSMPGPTALLLFGGDSTRQGHDSGAAADAAAAVAPALVPGAVSATVGPADAAMPHAERPVDLRDAMLGAYQRAVSLAPAGCGLDVSLLAAIGQVESGNLRGHRLDADHRATPAVLGPVLDGADGRAAVPDTDGGEWDGNRTWDRTVGPLQFVPTGWRLSGLDMDADGVRDPQDVEDAAGTAMVFLCATGADLTAGPGLRSAIHAFNPAPSYVPLVLAWKAAFAADGVDHAKATLPELTAAQYTRISLGMAVSAARTADALGPAGPAATPVQGPAQPGGPGGAGSPGPNAGPAPAGPWTPPRPWATPPAGGGGPSGAAPAPTPPGATGPSPAAPAPASDPPAYAAPADPAPADPTPSDPAPADPTPSDPPPPEPTPSDPAPSDPAPSDPTPTNPAPATTAPAEPSGSVSPNAAFSW